MAAARHRDLELIDALDACVREDFSGAVWRVAREGRDPCTGGPSRSRWCDGTFDVLYTSLQQDGAIAEIDSLLRMQPVVPSKMIFNLHRLEVRTQRSLRIADMRTLEQLGVDIARFKSRDYTRTAAIAETAYFLNYDALIAPSARFDYFNLVLFTERLAPEVIALAATTQNAIDFKDWRSGR